MLNINQSDSFYPNDNDNASQKIITSNKYHSILPDLATGWRPKNAKIAAPIFVTYQDPLTDIILKTTLGNLSKLVYVGPRHDNSYKFHSLTQNCYNVRYGIKCEEVPSKLKRELEQFTIKSNNRKNIFSGMNPNLDKDLQFQSNFESGNLDLVVKVSEHQYNLFLRPDTNTRGHMQWFYFKVTNSTYGHQKVRLNICNNKKEGVLYCRGMKSYVYSKHLQTIKGVKWQQIGQNIEYKKLSQKQDFCSYYSKIQEINEKLTSRYYCLSFDYVFETRSDEVYFAYCPPFTYSEMKQYIQTIKKRVSMDNRICLTEDTLCTSLTGLQIPILTISSADQTKQQQDQQKQRERNKEKEKDKDKKVIVVTGRFHPGESNGSFVLKGFIDYILSSEAENLRKKIVFKIVPIINPDGVVFGNYRTSLSGKDLNRKFKAKNGQLYPEVSNFKNFVLKLKKEEKMKILYFLDFHGHSMKKNVFLYGPEYDIWSTKFERSKILPKMISGRTNMFRYQSCLFRVAAAKRTTARAFMLGMIPYCYTIETSVGLYRQFGEKEKVNKYFSVEKWQEMGKLIGIGLSETLSKIQRQNVNVLKKKKKNWQLQEVQNNRQLRTKDSKVKFCKERNQILDCAYSREKQNSFENEKKQAKPEVAGRKIAINFFDRETKKQPQSDFENKCSISYGNLVQWKEPQALKQSAEDQIPSRSSSASSLSKKQKQREVDILRPVKNIKSLMLQMQIGISQINQVDEDSDRFSQGKSDCESDDNDFDKQEYKRISGKIMKFIENFNISIIGQRRKNFRTRSSKKHIHPTSKQKYFLGARKVSNYDMTMVPSLKHRLLKRELSEKKIGVEQQSQIKTKKMSIYRIQEQKKRNFN